MEKEGVQVGCRCPYRVQRCRVGRGPGNYLLRVVRGRHSCRKVQGPYA